LDSSFSCEIQPLTLHLYLHLPITYLPSLSSILNYTMTPSWERLASAKRDAILAAIPSEWRIPDLPSVQEQTDVTTYVEQFLSKEEVGITQCSADQIAGKTATGAWTAEAVARAFCHRAALAHQLVCMICWGVGGCVEGAGLVWRAMSVVDACWRADLCCSVQTCSLNSLDDCLLSFTLVNEPC
jgi:hypothetical protein